MLQKIEEFSRIGSIPSRTFQSEVLWPIGSRSLTMEKQANKILKKRLPFCNKRRIRLLLRKQTPPYRKCIKLSLCLTTLWPVMEQGLYMAYFMAYTLYRALLLRWTFENIRIHIRVQVRKMKICLLLKNR